MGRVDRAPRLVCAGLRHAADRIAGVGGPDLHPLTRLDPFAAYEELPFGRRGSHGASLCRRRRAVRTAAGQGSAPALRGRALAAGGFGVTLVSAMRVLGALLLPVAVLLPAAYVGHRLSEDRPAPVPPTAVVWAGRVFVDSKSLDRWLKA